MNRCHQCGQNIWQRQRGRKRKFCDDVCRRKYWIENPSKRKAYVRLCECCGISFKTYRKEQKYHDRRCRAEGRRHERQKTFENKRSITVWSCGGGIDSTAIAVLILREILPKPDLALMTAVNWEPETTWKHVYGLLKPAIENIGIPFHVVRTDDYVSSALFDAQGRLTIPAYRLVNGKVERFNTYCSGAWKLRTARQWMREQGIDRCINWVGIAADEARRARKSNVKWIENKYPLVELGMDRIDCMDVITEHGWPEPPRTSCFICPQRDHRSWRYLEKHSADDWERAIVIDQCIRSRIPDVYLHRSMRPLWQTVSRAKEVFEGGG